MEERTEEKRMHFSRSMDNSSTKAVMPAHRAKTEEDKPGNSSEGLGDYISS